MEEPMDTTTKEQLKELKGDDTDCQDEEDVFHECLDEDKIFGENWCPAFAHNESACIDLFFNVVPSSTVEEVHKYLDASWKESQEVTLRIIFNLGNVRKDGAGKQDRINFYRGLLWLWKKDPAIVLKNLWLVPKHASLKCLLNIHMYILHSDQADSLYSLPNQIKATEEHKAKKTKKSKGSATKEENRLKSWTDFAISLGVDSYKDLRKPRQKEQIKEHYSRGGRARRGHQNAADPRIATEWKTIPIAKQYKAFCKAREEAGVEAGKVALKVARRELYDVVVELKQDKDKVSLRDEVVRIFVEGLAKEVHQAKEKKSIGGLFAKWAPKQRSMHDKATGIAREIMEKLLSVLGKSTENGMDTYQKILSRLHELSQVPEHYVGDGRWSEVNYNRMASRCRLLWGKKVFKAHDEERYDEYLTKSTVKALTDKKSKDGVKTGVLLPHEVVTKSRKLRPESPETTPMDVVEVNLQWWGLVKATRKAIEAGESGGYCLPLCDVSGSMSGTPMEVAVALSMLLSEAIPKDSPLHGQILTFESQPKLCKVQSIPDYDMVIDQENLKDPQDTDNLLKHLGDVRSRSEEVMGFSWGGSTNIEAAFDIILDIALENKLTKEFVSGMSLVIFSDMEFDEARGQGYYHSENGGKPWDSMHQTITNKFSGAGYPELPKLVYWNLRASRSQPVKEANQKNVVLLSGFSGGLLKSFLAGKWDQFTPLNQMLQAVNGPNYQLLKL